MAAVARPPRASWCCARVALDTRRGSTAPDLPAGTALTARWLATPPAGWDDLCRRDPGASPAHRPEVALAFAAVVPGMQASFLALERDGVLVGGVPCVEERRGPLAWLHLLPMMLPASPLAAAGAEAVVDAHAGVAVAARAAATPGLVAGEWSGYRVGRPAFGGAPEAAQAGARSVETARLPLAGGPDQVLRGIDRKSRRMLAPDRSAAWTFAEEPAALEAAYALHLRQRTQWERSRPLPLALSRRLLADAAGPARLFTLRDREGVLSAVFALDGPHETFLWWSGTHPAGRRAQAFTRLVWGVVHWAHARGRTHVNLGASTGLDRVAGFKRSLGAEGLHYPVHALAPATGAPGAGPWHWLVHRWRRVRA